MTCFALIHSPFVGPLTWKFVAQVLEAQNYRTIIPALTDDKGDARPYWEQHASAAAQAINAWNLRDRCVLVGHSGAGPLLPIIGAQLKAPVAAYLFVDAGLPQPLSRLEMIRVELPERAGELEQFLKSGGLYPRWSDADLQALIPNEILRQQVLRDIRPRALPFFTEVLPVPEEWENVPCGYVQLSAGYAIPAKIARANEWPVLEFKGGHFHIMVDASSVGSALLQLAGLLLRAI